MTQAVVCSTAFLSPIVLSGIALTFQISNIGCNYQSGIADESGYLCLKYAVRLDQVIRPSSTCPKIQSTQTNLQGHARSRWDIKKKKTLRLSLNPRCSTSFPEKSRVDKHQYDAIVQSLQEALLVLSSSSFSQELSQNMTVNTFESYYHKNFQRVTQTHYCEDLAGQEKGREGEDQSNQA